MHRGRFSSLFVAAAVTSLVAATGAHAAQFDVTKTADSADGQCDSDCSLREAVIAANSQAGGDTIVLPAGTYALTITGAGEDASASGDLDVRDDTAITGAGADVTKIDAGGDTGLGDRVVDVLQNPVGGGPLIPSVTVSGLTITGGRASGSGGGVNAYGNVTLDHVTVTGNRASGEGGAVAEQGGGTTLVAARDSTISDNQASAGGAFVDLGGAKSTTTEAGIVIERSTVSGNRAVGSAGSTYGGAIAEDAGGDVRVRDSLLVANSAEAGQAYGGAVATNGAGTDTITNSTVSGNTASGNESSGGGLAEEGSSTVTLTNVTIADNSATGTGVSAVHQAGDIVLNGGAITTIRNTIVSTGSPANCVVAGGSQVASGHDIDSGSSCAFAGPGDRSGTDPLIAPLADNGGPTRTYRLLPGSPAIDSADASLCPATDQRGATRPQPAGGACDIGAFERVADDLALAQAVTQPTVTAGQPLEFTLTVTNSGPSDAPGVGVTDELPAGLALSSITTSAGSCTQAPAPSCSIGTLPAGATAHVTIRASGGVGEYDNVARVSQGPLAEDVQAANDQATAHAKVSAPVFPPPDLPTRGVDFNASAVRGTVLVSVPRSAPAKRVAGTPWANAAAAITAPHGYRPFRPLGKDENIPVGSILDATRGISRITMATDSASTKTQVGEFSKGVFRTSQRKGSALTTTTMMGGGNFKRGCRTRPVRSARRRPSRRLFANVHGRFRTRGRNSTATVRGTSYLVKDSCRGTLTTVRRGSVVVRDFRLHKNRIVRAGHSYFARARPRR